MSFGLLGPEIALAIVALLLVVADLAVREKSKPSLGYLGALLMIVPAILILTGAQPGASSFSGTLIADRFAQIFQLVFVVSGAVVMLASINYVRRYIDYPGEFYAVLTFATLGATMLAASGELITLYVALELTSISQFVLAGFAKRNQRSSEAGIKYLIVGALSSAALLYGMTLIYGATGTTNLLAIGQALRAGGPLREVALLGVVLVTAGFGFKTALAPFHMWVPDVYEGAPTPVTAYLSVGSKLAGFVVLLRVFNTAFQPLDTSWSLMFGVLAALTMTLGNLSALRQTNVKRLLGYSSVGQAGYALMGMAVSSQSTQSTTAGMIFFLVTYALTNLGVFTIVIYLSNRLESDELQDYSGLGRRSPLGALALTICLLSLIGLPPLAGFWSKVFLFFSVFNAGLVALVIVGLLNSAVAAYYYLKIVRAIYLAPPASEEPLAMDPPLALAAGAMVALVVVLGIVPAPLMQIATDAARALFPSV